MTFELPGSASCKLASADFQLQLLSLEPDDWVFLMIPTHWPTKETIPLGQGVPEMPNKVFKVKNKYLWGSSGLHGRLMTQRSLV